jgi:hypothetical protein
MKKSNTNMPIAFYVGLLVVFLTFFSVHMSSGLYARYTTTATGSATARVAMVDLSNTVITQDASIALNFFDPNKMSDTVEFQVASGSEVTMKYDVIVTLPEGNYSWMSVVLDEGAVGTVAGNVVTFTSVYTFSPNDATVKEHTLHFSIPQEHQGNLEGFMNASGEVQITVHAEQID